MLLVPQTSKVAKTQHLRRVYECVSSPQIRLSERNGPSFSEDADTTSGIRRQNFRHILKSRPMSEMKEQLQNAGPFLKQYNSVAPRLVSRFQG